MVCVLSNVPVSGTLLPAGQMAQQPDSQLINAAKRELSRPSEAISFCTILTFCNKTYFEERDRIYYLEGHQVWRYIYDMATLRLQTVFCPVQKVSWDDKLNLFDISVSYEIFLTLCCVLCTLLALLRGVLLCWPLYGNHLKWPWSLDLIWCVFYLFGFCLMVSILPVWQLCLSMDHCCMIGCRVFAVWCDKPCVRIATIET